MLDSRFADLFDLYYQKHALPRMKCLSNLDYWFSAHGGYWADRTLSTINKREVQDWVDSIGASSQSTATRAANQLAAIFAWGVKRGYCSSNPCVGIQKFKDIRRKRFLTPSELTKLKQALAKQPEIISDLVWLALLTSARKANLLSMRWDEIDLDLKIWEIPGSKFKNGDSHLIPLEGTALEILSRRKGLSTSVWVFPGRTGEHLKDPRRAWAKVKADAALNDFRFHDIRRTGGSYMAINGVSLLVIGKALGHKDQRSTEVYARLNLAPIREAFQSMNLSLGEDRPAS